MKAKISIEAATNEFEKWLETKKLSDRKKEQLQDSADTVIDSISFGKIIINDQNEIELLLDYPIKDDQGGIQLEKIVFKNRVTVQSIKSRLKGLSPNDNMAMTLAYTSAYTDIASGLLSKLDGDDFKTLNHIMVFFL